MTNYIIIRSRRRTIAIYIKNGAVEVRAPLKMSKLDIDKFVVSKEKWLHKHMNDSRSDMKQREIFALNYGDYVTFRGVNYPIAATPDKPLGFDGEYFNLPCGLTSQQIKFEIIKIYRKLASAYLTERVVHYAKVMNFSPKSIKINNAKTRWGSCSGRGNLNFSWRLIMAENDAIDYVVVHELAHLREMNHSSRFWTIVEGILPNYAECRNRLKDLQKRLNTENWS